ncbi:hypothetical protein GQ457_09G008020 [Hibiscus cannabinus]
MKNNVLKNEEASKIISRTVGNMSSDSQDSQMKPRLKRVLGHVEEEALKKLEKCLIGTMATVCSTCQVQDHLHAWGLNDVTVKYMGGFDELGLNFHPKQSDVPLQSKAKKSVEYSLGSSSDPSSVPDHSTAQTNGIRFNCIEEDEVAKAICLVNEFSSEINAMTSLGEKLDHQVVRWVDVVTKNLVSQGVRVGEDLTQLHNRNLVLDPCTGQEGCEAPFRRNPTYEEVGLSLSATKGILEVERPILSDGILPNIINRFCLVQLMPIVAEVC